MFPEELDQALHALGWTAPELARRLHRHRSYVDKLRQGHLVVPPPIAAWVRQARAHMARLPAFVEPIGTAEQAPPGLERAA